MSVRPIQLDPLFREDVVQDPYPYFDALRETEPVHEIPGTNCYLVTSMALVREVVARTADFSSANTVFLQTDLSMMDVLPTYGALENTPTARGEILATADGEVHRRQRMVVNRKFTTAQMDSFESQFESLAEEAIGPRLAVGTIEWMADVADLLPNVILARILGLPDDTATILRKAGYGSVERIGGFVTPARAAELGEAAVEAAMLIAGEYEAAKQDPDSYGDSMLAILARAATAGEIGDEESLAIMMLLVSAGGESTASLTGNAAYLLASDHEIQDRIRRDPALIPTFVEEALRIEPSFRGHYRVATNDTSIGGTTIPAGARVILAWSSANHDPATFADPNRVDLDRENPRHHVGFGWGIHLCVGAPLARAEARAAIRVLLRRTRQFALPSHFQGPCYHRSLMIRRLTELPLVFETEREV
jgi:cytochrome P450